MSRSFSTYVVCFIILMSLMPIFGHAFGTASNIDNRRLNSIPNWEGSLKEWFVGFDDYLNDNFGFRKEWVTVNRKIKDLLGEDPAKVAVGKNGWLFLANPDYRDEFEGKGRWDDMHVQNWIDALKALKNLADERDIPFAAMIAVDKSQMFPEYLPNNWVGPSSRRFRDYLYNHPDSEAAGLIDPEPVLREAKKKTRSPIYNSRDTHWNSTGAYLATNLLWEKIDPLNKRLRFRFDGNYINPVPSVPKDLERMAGYSKTSEPTVPLIPFPELPGYKTNPLPPKTEAAKARRFGVPTVEIVSDAPAPDGTLLIIGDSFANIPSRYLKTGFANVIRIHRRSGEIPLSEIALYEADAIVFINSERHAGWLKVPFVVDE